MFSVGRWWIDRLQKETSAGWDQIEHHVRSCDFPETSEGWLSLGREAGFATVRQIFVDPTNFYRLYRYDV